MKTTLLVFALIAGFAGVYYGERAFAEYGEKQAVKVPLNNYLMGHKTGKGEYMKKAFYKEGKLMFIRDGKYTTIDFKDYIGRMKGVPAKDEAKRKRKIGKIRINGKAAIAEIILDYPTAKIVDYMSLLKVDGEWKIVNKIFNVKSKAKRSS